ncbi:DUF1826 domain-containing protein [uncultured Sphingomonas sp.]|uniref:DUF1826 domain-containing protein n=1 Tax=uncultured Sphingomonas sp. TaxID=158754 RepID=UPI0035CB3DC9
MTATAVDGELVASSGNSAVLDEIRYPGVLLAIWLRAAPVSLSLADAGSFEAISFECPPAAVGTFLLAALEPTGHAAWHDAIAADAAQLAIRLAATIYVDQVEVRLEPVSTDGCWKFHSDYVTARLLTTYFGPGTQWTRADEEHAILRQLNTGDVAVFKGRVVDPDAGILHRSPPISQTGDRRILLVIGPTRTIMP